MLPHFSIKIALIIMTVGSLLSVVMAAAVRGEDWAIGVMIAVAAAPVMLLFHAFFYGLARMAGLLTSPRTAKGLPPMASPSTASPSTASPSTGGPAPASSLPNGGGAE